MAKSRKYELVDNGGEGGGDGYGASMRLQQAENLERRARRFMYAAVVMVLVSLLALMGATVVRRPSMLECDQLLSPWSSLWPAVKYTEGDLINFFNHTSIYRGPPTLERETAWNSLWYHHAMPVSKEGIYALNKTNPDLYYEVIGSDPAEPTYGGIPEVFHQLHCLNLIRQHSWPIEQFSKDWGDLYPDFLWDNPVLGRMHVDHCFEALRLALMCTSDITPVLNEHYDDPDFDRKADFNTHHKCRDFDSIAEYVEEMGYDLPPPKIFTDEDAHEGRRFITPVKPRERK
ncbi:tat pathway signal sequence [Cordyceps javanica]|uniref:Tat pathway signal sequence n=1 Tax=Cordyceps javanica TaxID=43265 RepID=A0A545UUF1_9HYPO|nr:tat pathway signal sequence [Cordyceps javanica]TQW05003.1 tat pathway signal sequence [Cordyceps javanica]